MEATKLNRGLALDPDHKDMPEGFTPFSKNGIFGDPAGSLASEPGWTLLAAKTPYTLIGKILAGDLIILFSTNNVNSAVGIFDPKTGVYTDSINDATQTWKFGFNTNYYITGQSQRNYRGDVIAAWTDKNIQPMLANLTTPGTIGDISELYLQPIADLPTIDMTKETGGSLTTGAYYAAVSLGKKDGTKTPWLDIQGPIPVGGSDPSAYQDAAVKVFISNIDPSYEIVNVAIIYKNASGVFFVYDLGETAVSNHTATVLFNSNTQSSTPLTLEEVLTPPIYYSKCGTMGLLTDSLYLGDLASDAEPSLQSYFNTAIVQWKSTKPDTAKKTGIKTFMHEEVYCLYGRFIKANGTRSRAYVLRGPAPATGDTAPDTDVDGLTGWQAIRFRTDPIPAAFSTVTNTGTMCHYANENETYPDTPDFGILRGQKVWHFRFPSIRWMKANLYASDDTYAVTWLDKLDLIVSGITLPGPEYTGYEIYYAKRTPDNSLHHGQTLLQFNAQDATLTTPIAMQSTGGNWHSHYELNSSDPYLWISQSQLRLLPFDMMFNRTALSSTFISEQLRMRRPTPATTGSKIEDGNTGGDGKNGPVVLLMDYMTQTVVPDTIDHIDRIHRIKEMKYVLNNTVFSVWKNLELETAVMVQLYSNINWPAPSAFGFEAHEENYVTNARFPQWEDTSLINCISLKQDVYFPFHQQSPVFGAKRSGSGELLVESGDSWISDYTYHNYGLWRPDLVRWESPSGGTKVCRRFICETISNLEGRYEIPADDYSKYYPKSPMPPSDPPTAYLIWLLVAKDPNNFGYSNVFHALNDLQTMTIMSGQIDDTGLYPDRIHRTGKISRQNKNRSWRTLLPLDFYEMPKTFGRIVRLQGFNDKLLVNLERAFYATVGNVSLEVSQLSLALGSGDIFRIEPQEAIPDTTGVAGLQHDLAATMSPAGYYFYDAEAAVHFLYNGQLSPINQLNNRFFRDLPIITERNVYVSDGIMAGYDPWFARILLTMRRKLKPPGYIGEYEEADLPTYVPGNIVLKDGYYQKFLGINTDPDHSCPSGARPVLSGYVEESGPFHYLYPTVQLVAKFKSTGHTKLISSSPYFYFARNASVPDEYNLFMAAGVPNNPAHIMDIVASNSYGATILQKTFYTTALMSLSDIIIQPPES